MESYVEIQIGGLLTLLLLNKHEDFSTYNEFYATVLAFVWLAISYYIPVSQYRIAVAYLKKLEEGESDPSGDLYFADVKKERAALFIHVVFYSRRLLFVQAAMFLQEYPTFQIGTHIMSTGAVIMYLGYNLPYKTKYQNTTEIVNELAVLFANYHAFTFTGFVPEFETREITGWSLIGVIALSIGGNCLAIVFFAFKDMLDKLKEYKREQTRKKLFAEKQRIIELKRMNTFLRLRAPQLAPFTLVNGP